MAFFLTFFSKYLSHSLADAHGNFATPVKRTINHYKTK
jgi:hypothetical protein